MVLTRKTSDLDPASRRASRRAYELAQRRADMLGAAADVFARKGYEGAQMAEIAAAAEVSLASLYAEFHGKDEIYAAVIEDAAKRMFAVLRERVEPVADPGSALLVLIDALFECFAQDVAVLRLVLSGSDGLPWKIRADRHSQAADEIDAWVQGLCRRAVRRNGLRGLDGAMLAHILIGGVLRVAADAIDRDPERPLTELAPRVRAFFARVLQEDAR